MSQNVYTIMYMNAEEERLCIKSWMDCGIVSIGQLFGPDGYLIMLSEQDFQMLRQIFLLYEGVSSAIRGYQRKLGLGVKENFVVGDS